MNVLKEYKVLIAVFFVINMVVLHWLLDRFYDVQGFGRATLNENGFQELIAFSMLSAFAFAVFMNLLVEIYVGNTADRVHEPRGLIAFAKAYWVYIFVALVCPIMVLHTVGAF